MREAADRQCPSAPVAVELQTRPRHSKKQYVLPLSGITGG